MFGIKNILVTTDYSSYSAEALAYAISIGTKFNATIHLLHVVVEPGETPESSMAAEETEMKRYIAEYVDEYVHITPAIRVGNPVQEIIDFAVEQSIDLIVMATHGRTGFAHILMGSIAEKIVRRAPMPVLTIKPVEMIEPLLTRNEVAEELHLEDGASHSLTGRER